VEQPVPSQIEQYRDDERPGVTREPYQFVFVNDPEYSGGEQDGPNRAVRCEKFDYGLETSPI
jgi:hypothetical protein